jgi:hypothetical protein
LGPGKSFVKEVPSVFIIPGLQGAAADKLKLLASQIMFRVLCAMLPSNSCSLSETASMLVKVIAHTLLKVCYTYILHLSFGDN